MKFPFRHGKVRRSHTPPVPASTEPAETGTGSQLLESLNSEKLGKAALKYICSG